MNMIENIRESYGRCSHRCNEQEIEEMNDEMKKIDDLNKTIDGLQAEIESLDHEIAIFRSQNQAMRQILHDQVDKRIDDLAQVYYKNNENE